MKHIKSQQIEAAARKVIPGGVMSNWKKSEGYHPTFMARGEAGRLWDADGNEFLDFSLSMGPAILGHSNEHLRSAMVDAAKGFYANEPIELQVRAAQKIVDHVACAELVRFANSGTEANLNALRVARAYTGKNMVVRFNGQYNGSTDSLIGGIVTDTDNPVPIAAVREGDLLSDIANTGGRAAHAFSDYYMIEWNDLEAMEKLFSSKADNIAAVIMEPVMVNFSGCMPEPGYLEGVRQLCDQYGVVLIFDEVLTGFRIGLKSAQGYFGVTPDMTTFGKAVGGGFPVSVFCGKREIMDVITRTEVTAGGTYNGHPMAMAAVVATIEELEKDGGAVYHHINALGNRLRGGLDGAAERQGANLLLQGFPGAWTFNFTHKDKIVNHLDSLSEPNSLPMANEFGNLLKEQGVLTLLRFCISAAHTEEDIDMVVERAEEAFKKMAQ